MNNGRDYTQYYQSHVVQILLNSNALLSVYDSGNTA